MKESLKIILADIKRENFTKREILTYGVVAPVVLFVILIIF